MSDTTITLYRLPSGEFVRLSSDWDDPSAPLLYQGPIERGFQSRARWRVAEGPRPASALDALAQLVESWRPEMCCSPHGPYDLTAAELAEDAELIGQEEVTP